MTSTDDRMSGNSFSASSQAREPDVSATCHIGHKVAAMLTSFDARGDPASGKDSRWTVGPHAIFGQAL